MTIILFIVDTSASTAQKNYKGSSILDISKNFVSDFIKARGRDVSARGFDRYMLITTEEYPQCVKEIRTTWRENALMEQMKILKPKGRQSLASAILNAFRLLNLNRGTTGIDNYGFGRYPYYMEPVYICSLSDGLAVDDISKDFKFELKQKLELTKEPFRWDQKLHSMVFRLPSQAPRFSPTGKVDTDMEIIEKVCSATGGRSFSITCHKQIPVCIDLFLSSMQFQGVGARFLCPNLKTPLPKANGENGLAPENVAEFKLKKRLETKPITTVLVRMVGGKPVTNHWPIPEAFWHTRLEGGTLPPRFSHPQISLMAEPSQSFILPDFPFDKYELEPSPVVDYVQEKLKDGNQDQCLPVFIFNSGKAEGFGKPFGYLKLTSTGSGVNFFLMPYNYPVLIQLLQELKGDQGLRNAPQWRKRLDVYLENVPPYYLTALRKNLDKWKISGGLLDEQNTMSQMYPSGLLSILNRIKPQSKEEYDRLCINITSYLQQQSGLPQAQIMSVERRPQISSSKHWSFESDAKKRERTRERKERTEEDFKDPAESLLTPNTPDRTKLQIHLNENRTKPQLGSSYRNPLVLGKRELLDYLPRMFTNINMLLRNSTIPQLGGGRPGYNIKLHHADELHSQPISMMGNYEEYIKGLAAIGKAPLREVEPKAVRSHAFGNPFKTDKKSLAIDEVGEGPALENTSAKESRRDRKATPASNRIPRRKPGPLGLNSMSQWREKRRTLSDRSSSVVSDMSYTMDIDAHMEPLSPLPDDPLIPNGFGGPRNGELNGVQQAQEDLQRLQMLSSSDDKAEVAVPSAKKMRFNDDLCPAELQNRKISLSSLIRRHNDDGLFEEIQKAIRGGSLEDSIELFQFSLRDSKRFKKKSLSQQLEKELSSLMKSNGKTIA